jgi:hypothetical protein
VKPPEPIDAQLVIDALARGENQSSAARVLGVSRNSVRTALWRASRLGLVPTPAVPAEAFALVEVPPDTSEPLEGLWDRRRASGRRVRELVAQGEVHTIAIHETGPVGILHLGDPHLDDPGCDFDRLAEEVDLVASTPGLYCGVLGDLQNNWAGRLAKLHSQQDVTSEQAWALIEEMLRRLSPRLLYLVAGNHDLWSSQGGDPLKWVMRAHRAAHSPHGLRIRFTFPNGTEIRLGARHDWPGGSQYNPAFGQGKAAFQGLGDHIVISGHRHSSGYMTYYNPHTGVLSHCLQVGSYKISDDYAKERGFSRNNLSPSVLTIIDPEAHSEAERVLVFPSVTQGVKVLRALRSGSSKPPA